MDASELLNESEMKAERAISFVRFAFPVVGVVTASFALEHTGASSTFAQQYPLILAGSAVYFAIGVVSLLVARPDRFRHWMPWVFSTCDIAFYFAILAGSVSNFGLPWNAIMATPPIWFTPFILALAALRYNPWLQAYTTVCVVLVLVAVGIIAQSGSADAVNTSPELRFLLGVPAYTGRGGMLLLAALALIVATVRARGLLNHAITETVQRSNLTRYLPPQLTEQMARTGEEALRTGRQQNVAVLFVDIRDFTARAEGMEPEALSRFLAEFRSVVTRAVEDRGGVVDKFVGDSAMVVFGAPEPDAHDAENALSGARAIISGIATWNDERGTKGADAIRIGVGIHWGQVFCGAVGDASRLEFTVLGDTVNVAARLQEATKAAGLPLVVSEALLKAARVDPTDEGWIALPETAIRGRQGEVRYFGSS